MLNPLTGFDFSDPINAFSRYREWRKDMTGDGYYFAIFPFQFGLQHVWDHLPGTGGETVVGNARGEGGRNERRKFCEKFSPSFDRSFTSLLVEVVLYGFP